MLDLADAFRVNVGVTVLFPLNDVLTSFEDIPDHTQTWTFFNTPVSWETKVIYVSLHYIRNDINKDLSVSQLQIRTSKLYNRLSQTL